jgi:hypothetical protein
MTTARDLQRSQRNRCRIFDTRKLSPRIARSLTNGSRAACLHLLQFHLIPTYSSWLNMVERFFALITEKAIRRGSFSSVKDLVNKIDHFVSQYNKNCLPFTWTATADSILAKLDRLTSRISGIGH